MVSTSQNTKATGPCPHHPPERRTPRPPQPAPGEIVFAIVPTLDGAKSLLDGVSARLPDQAPPAPPRKGRAWQQGYMSALGDARDIIAWVRDGLRLRDDIDVPPTRAEGR